MTKGEDLQRLGLEPGPSYSKILRQLRSGWLDGSISSEAEEMQALELLMSKER